MKQQQKEARSLMLEILQDSLLELRAESYRLNERFTEGQCEIILNVKDVTTDEVIHIEGVGVGLIDAVFQGLKDRLSSDYPSLNSIEFTAFDVAGIMSSGSDAKTDAEAKVSLGILNSYNNTFTFEAQSRSLGGACIQATLSAVAYFVNSERAFVKMYKARKHYQCEGRADLVSKYTDLMARMVSNTSYSEVIDRIKSEI